MKTKVYDKAAWHLDGGESIHSVLTHFTFMMAWLSKNGLLSTEGKEIEELGVDDSISLHSRMLTEKGNAFMEKYCDKYISATAEYSTLMDEALKTV